MTRSLAFWLAVCVVGYSIGGLVGRVAAADDPKPEEEAKAKAPVDPEVLRIHLMDGSQIGGKLAAKEIEVETSFGSLKIPVTSIRSLTPGLGSHPKVTQNLSELIEKLGSPVFGEREAAQKSLLELGPSVRLQLERSANDPDTERKTRIKALLEEFDQIEADAAEEEASGAHKLIERDTVETTDFTVVGRIVQQDFEIVSRYGSINAKLSDIRRVERTVAEKEELQKTVTVDGNAIIHRGLKDSGIRIERGDKITITAEGNLQMTPWGNQAISTPEGAQNFGWYVANKIAGGALVGKIGKSGQVFKIGGKYSGTAESSGTLQLAIAMQGDYANQNFPGEYKVRIKIKRK
ncbi:MAG TPA: hypothetical protein VGJ26_01025 [Pirellulales bacterium]|jgi:hypothetical protein